MTQESRILPLSSEAILQIQSSKQITTLPGVVLGLLENSLDAGSSKIEINVDFPRGGCTVSDNGAGIPRTDFLEAGGLAKMYHSSKCDLVASDRLHGSTGTFLSALAALSLLAITSCCPDDGTQANLTIHQGRVIRRNISATPTLKDTLSTSQGTCIIVRDLFGNMPVRIKQRSLAFDTGQDNDSAWHVLKRGVVALLLAWPNPCSIRICDEQNSSRIVHLSALHPTISTALTKKGLTILNGVRGKYDLGDALPVLWQAGLVSSETKDRWIPISAKTPGIVVKGSICLDPAPTKQCQFISIGVRPCSSYDMYHDIYHAVNKIFATSSFGAMDDESDIDEAEKDRRRFDRRFKSTEYTRRQLHARKSVDRWPMFVLHITLQNKHGPSIDPERISDSSLKAIDDVLTTIITQWLAGNHFRPQKQRRLRNEAQGGPEYPRPTVEYSSETGNERSRPRIPNAVRGDSEAVIPVQLASVSKKRKIVDIGGNHQHFLNTTNIAGTNAKDYFHSWSRIKSGRNSFYDNLWEGRKPATAPDEQRGVKITETEHRASTAFRLPTLEAGAFSRNDFHSTGSARNDRFTNSASHGIVNDPSAPEPSSEDYGSFDESAMLHAITTIPPGSDDQILGHVSDENIERPAEPASGTVPILKCTDPVSREIFEVNARTGMALQPIPPSKTLRSGAPTAKRNNAIESDLPDTASSSSRNGLSLARRPKDCGAKENSWLPGFLREWNNPVFVQQNEPRIPAASFADLVAMESANKNHHPFEQIGGFVAKKLSKAALSQARVVKQVDRKYILCTVDSPTDMNNGGETLILVDQHAASERVILERLLSELCTRSQDNIPISVVLEKALLFEVNEMEFQRLRQHKQHFADWGILYDLTQRADLFTASQVRPPQQHQTVIVRGLPPGIAERCMLVPKLLIELLRSEIWAVEDKPNVVRPTNGGAIGDSNDGAHSWLNRIGSCPKGILDMLNSRACRSAIMFNDELSTAECERLMSELSRCAFPFMCAHGRVSMVPVADLGMVLPEERVKNVVVLGSTGCSVAFTTHYTKWREKSKSGSVYGMND